MRPQNDRDGEGGREYRAGRGKIAYGTEHGCLHFVGVEGTKVQIISRI